MSLTTEPCGLGVELERDVDRRWIAEVPAVPGVIVYGDSPEDAVNAARRLAADVINVTRKRGWIAS